MASTTVGNTQTGERVAGGIVDYFATPSPSWSRLVRRSTDRAGPVHSSTGALSRVRRADLRGAVHAELES